MKIKISSIKQEELTDADRLKNEKALPPINPALMEEPKGVTNMMNQAVSALLIDSTISFIASRKA